MGPARLPAPGTPPARRRDGHGRAARRPGPGQLRRAARAARGRAVHGGSGGLLRVDVPYAPRRHQRPAGADPDPSRRRARGSCAEQSGSRPRRRLDAPRAHPGEHVERRRHGARRPRVHREGAQVRGLPRLRRVGAERGRTDPPTAEHLVGASGGRAPIGRSAGAYSRPCVAMRATRSPGRKLDGTADDPAQVYWCVHSLVVDGLLEPVGRDGFALPRGVPESRMGRRQVTAPSQLLALGRTAPGPWLL